MTRGAKGAPTPPSYRCPFCSMRSYNPSDIRAHYCGACHVTPADVVKSLDIGIAAAKEADIKRVLVLCRSAILIADKTFNREP